MRLVERVRRFRKEWAEAKRLSEWMAADRARRDARAKASAARPVRTQEETDAIVIANVATCAAALAVVTTLTGC